MTTRLYRGHYIHIYQAKDGKYVAQIAGALAHGPGPDHPDFAKLSPWTECLIRHGSEAAAFTGGRAEVDIVEERAMPADTNGRTERAATSDIEQTD